MKDEKEKRDKPFPVHSTVATVCAHLATTREPRPDS
jgi:hypothetical protein